MSILLKKAREDPESIGISKNLYRAVIFNSLCSCGKEIGVLQYEIQTASTNKPMVQVLNDMGITKFCCRRTILCAPNHIIVSSNKGTTIIDVPLDNSKPSITDHPLPKHAPFPIIPM